MFEKNYSMESIEKSLTNCNYGTITAQGTWSDVWGKWNVNTSTILTQLIHDAGRYCERFASDLFIDWKKVEERLANPDDCEGKFLFGFREDGMDDEMSMLIKLNDWHEPTCYYRSVWMLDITMVDDECRMTLKKVRL